MTCSVETDNAKPLGFLWEICFSVLFAPNSQVGLPAEISLDSLQALLERLSGTAACHLLWVGAGRGDPGSFRELPSGTAPSRRAPSGAAASGLLPDQDFFAPTEPNLCACSRFVVPTRSLQLSSRNLVGWGKVDLGSCVLPSLWFLFPPSANSSAPTRNSWSFRVAPAFLGEER